MCQVTESKSVSLAVNFISGEAKWSVFFDKYVLCQNLQIEFINI
jgi:hypothetical protein